MPSSARIYQQQPQWYLDPSTGRDTASGADSGHPIKTAAELVRRLGGERSGVVVIQPLGGVDEWPRLFGDIDGSNNPVPNTGIARILAGKYNCVLASAAWNCASYRQVPSFLKLRGDDRDGVIIDCSLDKTVGVSSSPFFANIVESPGSSHIPVSAANTPGSDLIQIATLNTGAGTIGVGSRILVSVSNAQQQSSYTVLGVTGTGPFTLRLERSVFFPVKPTGDSGVIGGGSGTSYVALLTSRPEGVDISNMTITGTCSSYFQPLGAYRWRFADCFLDGRSAGSGLGGGFVWDGGPVYGVCEDIYAIGCGATSCDFAGGEGVIGRRIVLDGQGTVQVGAEFEGMFASDVEIRSFGHSVANAKMSAESSPCFALRLSGSVSNTSGTGIQIDGSGHRIVLDMRANGCATGLVVTDDGSGTGPATDITLGSGADFSQNNVGLSISASCIVRASTLTINECGDKAIQSAGALSIDTLTCERNTAASVALVDVQGGRTRIGGGLITCDGPGQTGTIIRAGAVLDTGVTVQHNATTGGNPISFDVTTSTGRLILRSSAKSLLGPGAVAQIAVNGDSSGGICEYEDGADMTSAGAFAYSVAPGFILRHAQSVLAQPTNTNVSPSIPYYTARIPANPWALPGAGAQNNVPNPQRSNNEIQALGGAATITGIVAGTDGEEAWDANLSGQAVTYAHESGSSTAANRVHCTSGADLVLPDRGVVFRRYSAALARWVVTQGAAGTTGATGAAGAAGVDGQNAFAATTGTFTVPSPSATSTVSLSNNGFLNIGQEFFISGTGGSGTFTCTAASSGSGTFRNDGEPDITGSSISSGALVTPTGRRGPTGTTGSTGATGATGASGTVNNYFSPGTSLGGSLTTTATSHAQVTDVVVGAGQCVMLIVTLQATGASGMAAGGVFVEFERDAAGSATVIANNWIQNFPGLTETGGDPRTWTIMWVDRSPGAGTHTYDVLVGITSGTGTVTLSDCILSANVLTAAS